MIVLQDSKTKQVFMFPTLEQSYDFIDEYEYPYRLIPVDETNCDSCQRLAVCDFKDGARICKGCQHGKQ